MKKAKELEDSLNRELSRPNTPATAGSQGVLNSAASSPARPPHPNNVPHNSVCISRHLIRLGFEQ